MSYFLSWYLILTLLGWLTFPLVYHLLPALADRGYSLARAAGLLVWGYVFWLLTSLGLTQNNLAGIMFCLLAVTALSATMVMRNRTGQRFEALDWLRANLRYVFTVEVLFLVAFAFLAWLRAGNPELDSTEKPMELMFINAILRSPAFPPHDAWLSGYAISYYYFGYVLTAMLAKLTGIPGSIAHNLMSALIYGLAAIGAYGLLHNLLAGANRKAGPGFPFLALLFFLLVSNLEAFLEVLHKRGLFWSFNPDGTVVSGFWTWLDIKDLSDAPAPLPGGLGPRLSYWWVTQGWPGLGAWFNEQFAPDRFWWWWRASRVIHDTDLLKNSQEVIDEFPFFSFLLGDLHPHILAIPFNLLAIGLALNLFLGGWRGETDLFGFRLYISRTGIFIAGLVLGGLAFLNTWDILIGLALFVLAYALSRVREQGWGWSRFEDMLVLGLLIGALAFLLYLPFYFGFSSQAGGILPNLVNPARGAQLWVMFAPFFVPLFAYLLYLWRGEERPAAWRTSLLIVLGATLLLWILTWASAWIKAFQDPGFAQQFLDQQGEHTIGAFFRAATTRRLLYLGGLLTLLALLLPALAFLFADRTPEAKNQKTPEEDRTSSFVLVLMSLAALLVLVPEFFYLKDQFGTRMNTIFKFYYQAWLLWSIAASFGTAVLLQSLRGAADRLFRIGLALLLLMCLAYPLFGVATKTDGFNPPLGWTLDDFARIQRDTPDDAAAIRWLEQAPEGVVVEAVGGSYSGYARISVYTGLPSVLGWPGHESQWRGGGAEQGSRQADIATLYSTPDWPTAFTILKKYNIRYVYLGGLERSTYTVQQDKFDQNLTPVFQQGSATIYEVR